MPVFLECADRWPRERLLECQTEFAKFLVYDSVRCYEPARWDTAGTRFRRERDILLDR